MNEYRSVVIKTKCSHCGQEMHIQADSDLNISMEDGDAKPLVFMPDMNWDSFTERTIIDAY